MVHPSTLLGFALPSAPHCTSGPSPPVQPLRFIPSTLLRFALPSAPHCTSGPSHPVQSLRFIPSTLLGFALPSAPHCTSGPSHPRLSSLSSGHPPHCCSSNAADSVQSTSQPSQVVRPDFLPNVLCADFSFQPD